MSLAVGHNPLAGRPLYVEPGGAVADAISTYPEDADDLAVIGGTAQAHWFAGGNHTQAEVDRYVCAATAAAATPTLVLYAIPYRDGEGGHSAGGVADAADYGAFVAAVRTGIGGRHAVVIIEPDALVGVDGLDQSQRTERIALLGATVAAFAADRATIAYLDAGHSRWLSVPALAELLRAVGADRIRGVSLNVSNFGTTAEESSYGEQLVQPARSRAGPSPRGAHHLDPRPSRCPALDQAPR